MQVVHRVSFNTEVEADAGSQLRGMGIALNRGPIITWFEISEADSRWPEVKRIVTKSDLPFLTEKRFTEAEVRSTNWVYVRADYVWGYPMPKDDMGYMNLSFDPASECPECGAGRKQLAPLRLIGEPPWRGRVFLGIYWIVGVHARPDVVDCMREQGLSGLEAAPILKHESGEPLHTVAQLRFSHEIVHGLMDANLERDNPRCGHVKYIGASREVYRFHADALDGCPDFVRTAQLFGAGLHADRLVLGSAAFANLYLDKSWRGLRLEPVELVRPGQ